ncbi:MAG: complex I subunit 5 family protein [Desulfonatronovibrionaceae bacterium]
MNALLYAVIIPFFGAIVCIPSRGRIAASAAVLSAVFILGLSVKLLFLVWRQGAIHVQLGGWVAPLGIALRLDGLGVLFVLLTAMVGTLITLYAVRFFSAEQGQSDTAGYFWALWLILWAGLNGIFMCADLFNAYVLLEVTTMAAVGLSIISGSPASLKAGLRYLLAAMLGSFMYLLGVTLVYSKAGMLDFSLLSAVTEPGPVWASAFGFMVFGLALKSALLPFHFWLPPAHSNAPAPVSAILSALVVKASFFLLLRVWFTVFTGITRVPAGQLPGFFLGVLGGAAVLWGSLQAIRQIRMKPLLAYSTVGQMGYLFLVFALVSGPEGQKWSSLVWTGTVFYALSHCLAKAGLFLSVGCLVRAMGTDHLQAMRNVAGRLPVVTFALGVAGVSLMGLPPSAGFVAKWMLLRGSLAAGQWWWAGVIVLGGLLTAAYVFKILSYTFVPCSEDAAELQPVPWLMTLSALGLGVLCVLFGFRADEVITLLGQGTSAVLPGIGEGVP